MRRSPKRTARLRQALAGTLAAALLVGCGTSVASDTTPTTSTSSSSSSTSTVVATDGTSVDGALADNVEVEAGDTSHVQPNRPEVRHDSNCMGLGG